MDNKNSGRRNFIVGFIIWILSFIFGLNIKNEGIPNDEKITESTISAKDKRFGSKGDGITDDSASLQSFFNYVANNKLEGQIPAGTYLISKSITIPSTSGWKVTGANGNSTIIKQSKNNIPILRFLNMPSYLYGVQIRGMMFDYVNIQSSTNTTANCIQFETMVYQCIFDDLVFSGGAYGIYVLDDIQNPWGCSWDNLRFNGSLSIGAIRMSTLNAVPNNKFGRIFCDCTNMVGPVFNLKGYNSVIEVIEFIAANKGAELMYFQAGALFEIGAIKLEGGDYTNTKNEYLFELSKQTNIRIGQVSISGSYLKVRPTRHLYVFASTGGDPRAILTIGHLALSCQYGEISKGFAFGNIGFTSINTVDLKDGWKLSNITTNAVENITINDYKNNQLGTDRGDSNYNISLGDKNIFTYDTVLTSPRICILPSNGSELFNGLFYRVIIGEGVVSSNNTITFKSGSRTIATIDKGNVAIEFVWRKSSNPANGWVITDNTSLL